MSSITWPTPPEGPWEAWEATRERFGVGDLTLADLDMIAKGRRPRLSPEQRKRLQGAIAAGKVAGNGWADVWDDFLRTTP